MLRTIGGCHGFGPDMKISGTSFPFAAMCKATNRRFLAALTSLFHTVAQVLHLSTAYRALPGNLSSSVRSRTCSRVNVLHLEHTLDERNSGTLTTARWPRRSCWRRARNTTRETPAGLPFMELENDPSPNAITVRFGSSRGSRRLHFSVFLVGDLIEKDWMISSCNSAVKFEIKEETHGSGS